MVFFNAICVFANENINEYVFNNEMEGTIAQTQAQKE